jgi:hypothetical protein
LFDGSADPNAERRTSYLMDDLEFEIADAIDWFVADQDTPFVLVRVHEKHARTWIDILISPFRRCYITDEMLCDRAAEVAEETGDSIDTVLGEVLQSKLPDPGAVMAGDFGELLVYVYQAAKEHPQMTFGPKKWRLKQDRTKPAPRSNVITFVLPSWPNATEEDTVVCAEVKTKATNGASHPIAEAIADCARDRVSRLAATLVWLRERALGESLGAVQIAHLNRFINATDYPSARKRFRAVAVICSSLVEDEIEDAPGEKPADYELVVISVPHLREVYMSVFEAIRKSAAGVIRN